MGWGHRELLVNKGSSEESINSQRKQCMAVRMECVRQDKEGCAHSKDECSTVRREFSSPGLSHLAFGPSPFFSCQSSPKGVEVREGRAGEGKENMRHYIYFAILDSSSWKWPHNSCTFISYTGTGQRRGGKTAFPPRTAGPHGHCSWRPMLYPGL